MLLVDISAVCQNISHERDKKNVDFRNGLAKNAASIATVNCWENGHHEPAYVAKKSRCFCKNYDINADN